MNDSDREMQDQRKNTSMEDSTAMTIEFLRARLLSERSVSRTAKQRADELSKKVAELEEQLKIVSLQRKKAEKATADVLAILESQEMIDLSEDYDSSSDQETSPESAEDADSVKEEESSINSKLRINESEDFLGSEHDSSRGRLSWKGLKGTSHSVERCKGSSSMRRQTSLTSTTSSPRQHMGKSCRQIRHRGSRSVPEESKNGSTKVNAQENGVATSSKGFLSLPNGGSQVRDENVMENLDNQRSITNGGPDLNGYGRGKDMERALEHQAQLIGQYEEMEKAQREWEEKFRENNNSTPDSCDPGNYSDITEEREEIKAQQLQSHSGTQIPQAIELKSQTEDARLSTEPAKIPLDGSQQSLDTDSRYLQDQKDRNNLAYTSPSQEFEFQMEKGRQSQENPEKYMSNSSHEAEASGSRSDLHQKAEELGGVLEALKHARLALQQKMNVNGMPLADGAIVLAAKTRDRGEIPIECAGLFRLPTDFPIEAHAQAKNLSSGPQLSSSNYYPDRGIYTGEQYLANPYMDTRSVIPTEDRFVSRGYMDIGSGVPTQSYVDPRFDMGLQTQHYVDPRFTHSSYPDRMVQMPANEGFSRHVLSNRMPPENCFPLYDNGIRPPSLYRR